MKNPHSPLNFLSFPFLFSSFLFLVVVFKAAKSRARKLPPSPRKLPIIGHLHHLRGNVHHRALRDLSRRHGPVMYLKLGQVDHVVISSPEAAREIMQTHDLIFATRPRLLIPEMLHHCTDIAFAPYGNYWRQLRKICIVELLSAKRVKAFATPQQEEISNLVGNISMLNKSPVNLSEKLSLLTNGVISRVACGRTCKHGQRIISACKKLTALASGFCVADLFPSFGFIDTLSGLRSASANARRELDEILEDIIKEHQEKRAATNSNKGDDQREEDLVDVLLGLKENGGLEFPLTHTNIKAVIMDMFFAGTDTSSETMVWAMAELMKQPEVMEKAQAEVRRVLKGKAKIEEGDMSEFHYMKLVIKETLRLHPPVPLLLPRVCTKSCQVDGYDIPVGSRVMINAWAIGRDPRYWEDPESFKPERFEGSSVDFVGGSFELVPFGGGRRICPGMNFGLAEMELFLSHLLYYFDWKLPNGMGPDDVEMTETFGSTVGRKSPLCLIATPYVPI
ncbi:premnaspirodiene oxygenase-like [Phoenix dactylifera]|uniref:Premnaspirodiene oxygenase-like n=1 Tax=Phoenix dactylifera TaxID=42345 RepID=A0A8B9A5Y6_PHODC|nr:premnaspirodiene oxygenase-like [Phoenix dactylifera]